MTAASAIKEILEAGAIIDAKTDGVAIRKERKEIKKSWRTAHT